MSVEWHSVKFIKIEQATPNIRRFWLEVTDVEVFEFVPGQFITLELPISDKLKERLRSYSIASNPDGTNVIELVIVLMDHGEGTHYLFDEVQIGDEVKMMGPLGKFTLPEEIEKDICFVCTGTGIAPFRSMIKDLYRNKKGYKNIYLIFGTRTIKDILYYDEMLALSKEMPDFHYVVTLSRETAATWKGGKGYVHAIYEEIFADKRPADFYLCGWREMIDEARERLKEMGYSHQNIHLEIYG